MAALPAMFSPVTGKRLPDVCPSPEKPSREVFNVAISKLGYLANVETLSYGNETGSLDETNRYYRTHHYSAKFCPRTPTDDEVTSSQNEDNHLTSVIQHYMARDEDGSYKKWVERKLLEKRLKRERQRAMSVVLPEIQAVPGHYNPTRTETTNQTYGKYNDLLGRQQIQYPNVAPKHFKPMKLAVTMTKSNIAHNLSESFNEHDGHYLCTSKYGKIQNPEDSTNQEARFNVRKFPIFERKPDRTGAYTFPLYRETGLEFDRSV